MYSGEGAHTFSSKDRPFKYFKSAFKKSLKWHGPDLIIIFKVVPTSSDFIVLSGQTYHSNSQIKKKL